MYSSRTTHTTSRLQSLSLATANDAAGFVIEAILGQIMRVGAEDRPRAVTVAFLTSEVPHRIISHPSFLAFQGVFQREKQKRKNSLEKGADDSPVRSEGGNSFVEDRPDAIYSRRERKQFLANFLSSVYE